MHELAGMAYEVPLITVRYARHLVRFMEARGIGRKALLSQVAIEPQMLNNPDALLSMRQIRELLVQAQRLLPDERTPFRFGQELGLAAHGLLGFTLLKRRTQRELVSIVVQYLRVALPIMDMEVSCAGDRIFIRLIDIWRLQELRAFVARIYMGSVHALASLVCKRFRFEFDFCSSLPVGEWSELADGAEMVFSTERNQVTMLLSDQMPDYRDLDVPFYLTDAHGHQEQAASNVMEVVMQVRQYLLNHPGRRATLEQVAEQLGMSPRSVRRHLGAAGISFHDMRREIRQTYATRYLRDTRVSLTRIAEMLGYSDQASFTKAYRTWTGKTPGQVRRDIPFIRSEI